MVVQLQMILGDGSQQQMIYGGVDSTVTDESYGDCVQSQVISGDIVHSYR